MNLTENDISAKERKIYDILESVTDPEIPVLSIRDLGIVRKVLVKDAHHAEITITPTYTGCPAMDTISDDIIIALKKEDIEAEIKTVIAPAWTTDWLTEKGKRNLEKYGIAPPVGSSHDKSLLTDATREIRCPQCKSVNTVVISHFGSTACKALYKCKDCLEPFDYFKCL